MATSALLRALRRSHSPQATLQSVMRANAQAANGYHHWNCRNLSMLNDFTKQSKGEANRTQITTEKIYKSVDDVWTKAEAASKKVSPNAKQKLSATKEEVNGASQIGEENIASKTSTHERTKASSHSSEETQETSSPATLFSMLKSTVLSASPVVSSAFSKLKDTRLCTLAKQGYDIMIGELRSGKSKKNHFRHAPAASIERSTATDIVVVPVKKSILHKEWEAFRNKMLGSPVYKTLSEYTKPVATIGQELVEDVRERWETSDNPVVHKIQDLNDSIFEETATGMAYREIRRRDPLFCLADFITDVQEIIKPVLVAYSKGDTDTLKMYCSKELIERCKGERQAYASQNIFLDNKILHISEAHVREGKMLGSTPAIILNFQTQQIYCARDREGQITQGGQDTIETVYYLWAMQLMDSDELPEEESYYPVWRLREMQRVGVKALI